MKTEKLKNVNDKMIQDLMDQSIDTIFTSKKEVIEILAHEIRNEFNDPSFHYEAALFSLYLVKTLPITINKTLSASAYVYIFYSVYKIQEMTIGELSIVSHLNDLISEVISVLKNSEKKARDSKIKACLEKYEGGNLNCNEPKFYPYIQNIVNIVIMVTDEFEKTFKRVKEDAELLLYKTYRRRFISKVGEYIYSIPIDSIQCFFSCGRATYLFTKDGKKYLIDQCLQEVEKYIDPQIFFRINRKYIIRDTSISKTIEFSQCRLKVYLKEIDDDDIVISREKVNLFKSWLDS
jgi:hypothetical protein